MYPMPSYGAAVGPDANAAGGTMTADKAQQPQVCLCQRVCPVYQDGFKLTHNICPLEGCNKRTSHTSPPAPALDIKKAIDELEYSLKAGAQEQIDDHIREAIWILKGGEH